MSFVGGHNSPHDQASRLRALVSGEAAPCDSATFGREAPDPQRGPVIAITSGKGGVGKSSIGVNLCASLARLGVRAAMIDADLGMANADVLCGMTPTRRIEHAVEQVGELDLNSLALEAPGGFRLVPGSSGIARIADMGELDLARLVRGARRLARGNGAVVVDTGAGLGASVVSLASAADAAVVIATPEPTSITDAYAMIKCLHRGGATGVISLLINRSENEREAHAVCDKISSVTERFLGFRPLFAGWVPEDPAVGRAVRSRRPFVLTEPASRAAASLSRLAESIAATLPANRAEKSESRTMFGRFAAWVGRNAYAENDENAQFSARGSRGFLNITSGISKPGLTPSR